MFTGIVEAVGTVADLTRADDHASLRVTAPSAVLDDLAVGDSVAVDGVCLTVVAVEEAGFAVDVVAETLRRSTLGDRRPGDGVNLERAMLATGRFDGHIVQGHVDGVGEVVASTSEGGGQRITIRPPVGLNRYLVEKGSVTVQGASLTVAGLEGGDFAIAVIPHTLEVTTLGRLRPGDRVNLEVDVIAKYVERLTRP